MMTARTGRFVLALLALSLSGNLLCAGFLSTAAQAMTDPQSIIRERVEKAIEGLTDKDQTMVEERYDAFLDKYAPLIDETKQERKALLHTLIAPAVDRKQAHAEALKIRGLTATLQEALQDTIIDVAANLPQDEKEKIVENSRALKALAK